MPTPRTTLADQIAMTVIPGIVEGRRAQYGDLRDPDYWTGVMQSAHAASAAYMRLRADRLARQRSGK